MCTKAMQILNHFTNATFFFLESHHLLSFHFKSNSIILFLVFWPIIYKTLAWQYTQIIL